MDNTRMIKKLERMKKNIEGGNKMKVLVGTKDTQGKRKNDFSFTDEGELVTFGTECDREAVDGHCGCKRSLVGMKTRKGTTTFKVVEKKISKVNYLQALKESTEGAFPGFEIRLSNLFQSPIWIYPLYSEPSAGGGPEIIRYQPLVQSSI